jgi:hypothetical protein
MVSGYPGQPYRIGASERLPLCTRLTSRFSSFNFVLHGQERIREWVPVILTRVWRKVHYGGPEQKSLS